MSAVISHDTTRHSCLLLRSGEGRGSEAGRDEAGRGVREPMRVRKLTHPKNVRGSRKEAFLL